MQTEHDASRRVHDRGTGVETLLLRLTAWGTAAALAVGVVVLTAQTPQGSERLQVAFAGTASQQPATAAVNRPDPALATLQAKLDRLSADRERLEARLASLEHGLDDITGSIRSQAEKREASVQPPPNSRPIIEPPLIPPMETLTLTPKPANEPQAEAQPSAAPVERASAAAVPEPVQPEATPEPKSERPLPPARVAALPSRAHRGAEYGIEIGNAPDLASLQSRWTGIKANFGPLLVGLSPVAVRDKHSGHSALKLLAGPVKSMAAARELCAKFAAQNGYCFPRQVDAADVVQR